MVYGIDTARAGVLKNSSLENHASQSKSNVCGQGCFLFALACITICHEIAAVDSSQAGIDW